MSDRYDDISDDIKDKFLEIVEKKAFNTKIGFAFVSDSKLKKLVKVSKLTEVYNFLLNKEILVYINEDIYDKLEEDIVEILFDQEIEKITFDYEKGKIIMDKPDLVTFSPLLAKYGTEAVLRANEVDDLVNKQKEDMESDFH
jgi:predicted house-cleaning noncanonical NTP pyrophosphatase (MazG superfamily)